MSSESPIQAEERLAAACALSLVGGFTDVYSYLCRGHVFANAVTGNMVLLGLGAALGALLLKTVGRASFLLAPTLLVAVLMLLTTKRQHVKLRRIFRRSHNSAAHSSLPR